MKRLVVGVMGHVDHGKTALVGALTGMETDRLAEEKRRGISIALGFAHFEPIPDSRIDLVDMPGHERFIRTMIGGASGIDAALLVVSANEGLRPQSREHAQIASLLGIRRALVAVSKCDLAEPGQAQLVAEDATTMLESLGISVSGCVMTSVPQRTGLAELGQALAVMAAAGASRGDDGLAFLPIDRTFAVAGHGPVVTGTLRGSSLAVGDRLHLLPSSREVRLRALQINGIPVEQSAPGQRVAANLRDVGLADLARGMALAARDSLRPTRWFAIRLAVLADSCPLRNGMALQVAFATTSTSARLRLLDRDEIPPGETAMAQLHLAEPAFLPPGEHVVLRSSDLTRTLGGGPLLDNTDRRLKRRDGAVLGRLERLAGGALEEIVAGEIRAAGSKGLPIADLVHLTGKAPQRLEPVVAAAGGAITREGMVIPAAEVRRRLALKARPAEQRPVDDGPLERRLAAAGLTPPTPRELQADPVAAPAINRLLRRGALVRAIDRDKGKELFFHASAIAEARSRLAPLLAQGKGLSVSEIAAALGISRKFVMPLLDHLDGSGFTCRLGDLRFAGERRTRDAGQGAG